ncbi:MAG: YqiA/YcfP family alpha/beta fold hydrolase [Bryobacteraceae bacterium]
MIIYLHGFASGPGSRKAQFFREQFAGVGIDLLIPDLAAGDFENLTISGQLEVIGRLAAGRPVTLIGSSMGGYLAALYAARHPEVQRVVLMAPAFGFLERWAATLGEERVQQWRESGYTSMYHYGDKAERRLSYRLIEDGKRYEDFPEVLQPALVLHGTRDTVVPPSASERFAQLRTNARLHLIDSDHELTDVLPLLWDLMREFLL